MQYEVEQKFRADNTIALRQSLAELGVSLEAAIRQVDCYYAHPARDFGVTDEALRIRSVGERHFITYKGPKIDTTTKTRREIELPLGQGADIASNWDQLLHALGFQPVARVAKQRVRGIVRWQEAQIEIVLDDVDGLGQYVELELQAGDEQLDVAREQLASLAAHLGLRHSERRSYLELLLENQRHGNGVTDPSARRPDPAG